MSDSNPRGPGCYCSPRTAKVDKWEEAGVPCQWVCKRPLLEGSPKNGRVPWEGMLQWIGAMECGWAKKQERKQFPACFPTFSGRFEDQCLEKFPACEKLQGTKEIIIM